ncbi:MAG: O-antigen ligase family protein [Bacteroidetes bacterium]|nr:O-antigen ligase family protein [Bacteroidota bacterium]
MVSDITYERSFIYERWIDRILWLTIVFLPISIIPIYVTDIFDVIKGPLIVISGISITTLLILNRKWDNSIIFWLILCYLFLVFLSSIFAHNVLLAFTGVTPKGGRFEGFITILIYFILFYASRNYLVVTRKKIIRAFSGLSIVAVYALVQYYQFDPLVIYRNFRPIVFSTIGNPNFLGSLMVMICSLSFGLAVYYKKWYYYLFLVLFFSALLASQTRGCWIAFGIVIFCHSLLVIIFDKTKFFGLFIALIMMSLVIFTLNFTKKNAISKRTKSIRTEIKMKDQFGGSGRLKIWEITWGVVRAHPILGTGPENLKPVLKTEFKNELNVYYRTKGVVIDKAHNEYLHIAAVTGIPSLIIYLVLLAFIFWKNIPQFKRDKNKIIVGLAVLGYLLQAFTNISVIAVAPLFWILLGYFSTSVKEVY